MKWVTTILLVFVTAFVAFILWYGWDSRQNRGFTFGYYGQFNTVRNALEAMPGVTIVSLGYNPDVTLEEFNFTIRTDRDQEIELWFSETDPVRALSGEKLSSALREKIEKASPKVEIQPPITNGSQQEN